MNCNHGWEDESGYPSMCLECLRDEAKTARHLARELHHMLVTMERTVGDELREAEYPWLIDERDDDILSGEGMNPAAKGG